MLLSLQSFPRKRQAPDDSRRANLTGLGTQNSIFFFRNLSRRKQIAAHA